MIASHTRAIAPLLAMLVLAPAGCADSGSGADDAGTVGDLQAVSDAEGTADGPVADQIATDSPRPDANAADGAADAGADAHVADAVGADLAGDSLSSDIGADAAIDSIASDAAVDLIGPDLPPPDAAWTMPPIPAGRPLAGLSASAQAGVACSGPLAGQPAVVCVDDDNGTASQLGTAAAPYKTIGAAVAAAKAGDTIQVAAGTYQENIVVTKKLSLRGGFIGGSSYASGGSGNFSSRTPKTHISHVQGAGAAASVAFDTADASELDGFRVTGGTGTLDTSGLRNGGGVYVAYCSPTISHNLIEDNDIVAGNLSQGEALGGGIYIFTAPDTQVIENVVRNNTGGRGGGIGGLAARVIVRGNHVEGNTATGDHGGGIYLAGDGLEVHDNTISGNSVGTPSTGAWGGGVIIFGVGTTVDMKRNIVTGNYASESGSGVFIDDGATATLTNELIYANVCPGDSGSGLYVDGLDSISSSVTVLYSTIAAHGCAGPSAILVEAPSSVTLEGSVLWGNGGDDFETINGPTATISARYTLSQEGIGGTGNFSQDPLFVAAAQGDLHLRSTRGRFDPSAAAGQGAWVVDATLSPAIDAADPATAVALEPAPNGARRNLGAYAGTAAASLSP